MKKRLYLKDEIINRMISKLHVYECVKSQVDLNLLNSMNVGFIHTGDSVSEHVHKVVNRVLYIELNETFTHYKIT